MEDLEAEVLRQQLVQGIGANLSAQIVAERISPECPYKVPICQWKLKLWLLDSQLGFVCRGMRDCVARNN